MGNISNRINVTIEKLNDKIIVVIPPGYTWKNHHKYLYIIVIAYFIFTIFNLDFSLDFNILGKLYISCFLLTFVCDKSLFIVISYCQFLFSIVILLGDVIELGYYLPIVFSIVQIIEIIFFANFKNSIFRELLGETYIDISPSKIYIYKKVFFLYQADFVYGIGLEPPHKVIATLLGFHKSHEYGSIIKANQIC